ncbi:MAG: hypothetical protein FJ284_12405 [Planctomycetes bacterium]|nr:hypothetical protein [Planctomycetota bacterium]
MSPQAAAEKMLDQLAASAAHSLQHEQLDRHDRFGFEADARLRLVHDRLVAVDWTVETHTRGSVYYTKGGERLRLSNHEVPGTAEREHAASSGGWTWHRHGWQITTRSNLDACLAQIYEIEEALAE